MKNLDKSEIAKILTSKGALHPCHRCGGKNFSILDGFSKLLIDNDLTQIQTITIGGPTVPIVMVVCNNCGAITMHAMGALELMPKNGDKENA
jgi:hypothetical protein